MKQCNVRRQPFYTINLSIVSHFASSASFNTIWPHIISAQKAIHRKVKCGIIIFNSINQFTNVNVYFQFFFYFSHKSLLRCFTFFNLSSWKFPLALDSPYPLAVAKICFLSLIESQITAATTFIVFILRQINSSIFFSMQNSTPSFFYPTLQIQQQ